MKTYLQRTSSATRKLFDAADTYKKILRDNPPPILITDSSSDFEEKPILRNWATKNRGAIRMANAAARHFVTESFALSVLCGSILQIAFMGIQMIGRESEIPEEYTGLIKPNQTAAKFCVGRLVRSVPLGLVVYAGRNQYNHMDESKLSKLNQCIFLKLAQNWGKSETPDVLDPAFTLGNPHLTSFASNVVAVLGWEKYRDYQEDMLALGGQGT